MKHRTIFTIALSLLVSAPACDSPDDEAKLQALDDEDNDHIQAQADEETKANLDEFDLKANTEQNFPAGKCCKALCTWKPNTWQQLPQPYTQADNCNVNADYFCGFQHLIDAQWRTCG